MWSIYHYLFGFTISMKAFHITLNKSVWNGPYISGVLMLLFWPSALLQPLTFLIRQFGTIKSLVFKSKVYIVVLSSCVSFSRACWAHSSISVETELRHFHVQLAHMLRCIVSMSDWLHIIGKGMQPMAKSGKHKSLWS